MFNFLWQTFSNYLIPSTEITFWCSDLRLNTDCISTNSVCIKSTSVTLYWITSGQWTFKVFWDPTCTPISCQKGPYLHFNSPIIEHIKAAFHPVKQYQWECYILIELKIMLILLIWPMATHESHEITVYCLSNPCPEEKNVIYY